jgi:hypothetical protein
MTAISQESALATEPRMYTIPDLVRMLRLSRSVLYEDIRAKKLRVIHRGRSTRATDAAVREYIALLEKEAEAR